MALFSQPLRRLQAARFALGGIRLPLIICGMMSNKWDQASRARRTWAPAAALLLAIANGAAGAGNGGHFLADTMSDADEYHQLISERVNSAALRIDEWLGGDSADAEAENDTMLRARLTLRINQGRAFNIQPALSGHLALPALKKQARIFVDNFARTVVPGREDDRERDREEFRTGLRFDLYRRLRSLLQWDVGVKFNPLPVGFTTLTAMLRRPVGKWHVTLSEQGFWYSDDGFGEISEMDWDYPLASNVLFRSITAAVWSETSKGVEFEQRARTTWTITKEKRYLQFEAGAFAHKSSNAVMDDYRLVLAYSTSAHRNWLFLEIAPQLDFPREKSFDPTPSLRVSVSAYFGGNYL